MSCKIVIVAEAWGAEEEIAKRALIGPSGQELLRMLSDAGIPQSSIGLKTNVFNLHPPSNNLEYFLTSRGPEASTIYKVPLVQAKVLKKEFEPELARLFAELEEFRPNLAILLGNTACWALLTDSRISKIRGTISNSSVLPWLKCLPTYHPAAVLRQYELRHTVILDLMKAREEAEFPDVRMPIREIWLDPTLEDIERFYTDYIENAEYLAFDIETNYGSQITCIGFAPSRDRAICIPFFDQRKPTNCYWGTIEEELSAWELVAKILGSRAKKIAQNGTFDMQHIWQTYGIHIENAGEDTMLLHHSLHPEAPKALDFLGSLYTNTPPWKTMKPKGRSVTTIKRND